MVGWTGGKVPREGCEASASYCQRSLLDWSLSVALLSTMGRRSGAGKSSSRQNRLPFPGTANRLDSVGDARPKRTSRPDVRSRIKAKDCCRANVSNCRWPSTCVGLPDRRTPGSPRPAKPNRLRTLPIPMAPKRHARR